jgi:hypothetical protein
MSKHPTSADRNAYTRNLTRLEANVSDQIMVDCPSCHIGWLYVTLYWEDTDGQGRWEIDDTDATCKCVENGLLRDEDTYFDRVLAAAVELIP